MKIMSLAAVMIGVACPALAQSATPEWIADPTNGCRVRNTDAQPNVAVSWSGKCPNGRAEGRGLLQWFRDGKPAGRYDGELRDGMKNGRGVYTFVTGGRYDGEWRDGKRTGRGVMMYSSGNRYEGEFVNDKRHGRGIFTYTDGSRYEGEWRNDLPNGVGTSKQPDGSTYSGTWTNGCIRQGDGWATFGTKKQACGFK